MNLLPTVTVGPPEKTSDPLRDQLIDARALACTQPKPRRNCICCKIRVRPTRQNSCIALSPARSIQPVDWPRQPSGRHTGLWTRQPHHGPAGALADHRTKAGLLLARRIDQGCGKPRDLSCYTEPLVRFWLPGAEPVDVDAESDALPFGEIPPSLDTRDARFIHFLPQDEKKPEAVPLSSRQATEKSVAEADLTFHETDLLANIEVQLGRARAQEVRSMLRNSGERERQAFFEQLAMRTFPGATGVTGTAAHENDPEQPLKLSVRCHRSAVYQFAEWFNRDRSTCSCPGPGDPLWQDSNTEVSAFD